MIPTVNGDLSGFYSTGLLISFRGYNTQMCIYYYSRGGNALVETINALVERKGLRAQFDIGYKHESPMRITGDIVPQHLYECCAGPFHNRATLGQLVVKMRYNERTDRDLDQTMC